MSKFSLSNNALKTLNFNLYERDFSFFVGQKEYKVSKIFADFISPYVNKIHKTDPTLNAYYIPKYRNTKEKSNANDCFENILHLSEGNEIEVNNFNSSQILYYFDKLGNSEFLDFLLSSENFQEITEENAIDRLLTKISFSINAKEELAFISSNLYDFDDNRLSLLGVETISLILSQPCLRIQSEEWLFDFISKNVSKDPSYISLFEYVEFCNISVERIFQFGEMITLDELNQKIWMSIFKRLLCEIVSSPSNRENKIKSHKYISSSMHNLKRKTFKFDGLLESDSNNQNNVVFNHNGIISYLYDINNGKNPAKGNNRLIDISVSSCESLNSSANFQNEARNIDDSLSDLSFSNDDSDSEITLTENEEEERNNLNLTINSQFEPENITDFDSDSRFYSKDEPNQFIMIDFKNRRINPTHYLIKTQGCGANCCHMKSWVCELSEDGTKWIEGDKQINSSELNGSFMVGVFAIKTEAPLKYRYVRIRQTGPNWFNDNRMIMCGVEFFGTLYE